MVENNDMDSIRLFFDVPVGSEQVAETQPAAIGPAA